MRRAITCLALIILATEWSSWAQTTVDAGATYTVNGPSGPFFVGGTLNVESPASVEGSNAVQTGIAILGGINSTINILGGQVTGTTLNYYAGSFPSDGIALWITDCLGRTDRGAPGSSLTDPGSGVLLVSSGSAQISGGTFVGARFLGLGTTEVGD